MTISYSRQQYLAEVGNKRASREPSEFGKVIPEGSEDCIQARFFVWVDLYKERFEDLKLCFAIPNGTHTTKTVRYVMKLTGRRPGVPDVQLAVARKGKTSLWIEFKVPGKYATPEQREWHDRLRAAGALVFVCKSWMEAANIVIDYLNLPLELFKI